MTQAIMVTTMATILIRSGTNRPPIGGQTLTRIFTTTHSLIMVITTSASKQANGEIDK
jgi:hypothetical protein